MNDKPTAQPLPMFAEVVKDPEDGSLYLNVLVPFNLTGKVSKQGKGDNLVHYFGRDSFGAAAGDSGANIPELRVQVNVVSDLPEGYVPPKDVQTPEARAAVRRIMGLPSAGVKS